MATKRVRLTQRRRRAVEDDIPYPGTVNQPGRTFKRRDEYDNWEETINHPLPDMRHEWKDNPRDEIGFGIPDETVPTVASVRVAASKAVKLAVLLLGDKVGEEVVEEQARDFMRLSEESLDASLRRFAESEKLYTASDETEDEESEDSKTAEDKTAEDKAAADKAEEDAEEKAAETVQEEAEEEAKDKDEKKAYDESEAETEGVPVEGIDIELTAAAQDEVTLSDEDAAELAQIFAADEETDGEAETAEDETKTASEKTGVKKLGGQPRVASESASPLDNIGEIWESPPDVNSLFQ